jgi:hypothetical protein
MIRVYTHLDAYWDVRKDPSIHTASLYDLDFPLYHFLCGHQLFCAKPRSVALYPDSPFAKGKGRALDRATDWDWNSPFVTLDVLYPTGRQLRAGSR